jgi:hypothetical protein
MRTRSAKPKKTPELIPTPPAVSRHRGLIIAIAVTLLLGGIPFGLGKYIEFNSPDPFDGSAYAYSARHLLDGARLGVDENPTANPGTLAVNLIGVKLFGFSDTGPKVVQLLLQLAGGIFMFWTVRKVFGATAAAVSTITAAIYLSAPLIAKFGNVKEQYMIVFMISAACCFLLSEHFSKKWLMVLCGFFAVQGYYFKPTGISIVAAVILYLLIHRSLNRRWKGLFADLLLVLHGMMAGLIVPASVFLWQQRMDMMLTTFPVAAIRFGLGLIALASLAIGIVYVVRRYRVWQSLTAIPKPLVIKGAVAAASALLIGAVGVTAANLHHAKTYPSLSVGQDLAGYVRDMPFVAGPVKVYHFGQTSVRNVLGAVGYKGGYAENSWKGTSLSRLAPQVFRYYKALSVPILLALASIAAAAVMHGRMLLGRRSSPVNPAVWMLAIWWMLDMGLIWVSPRSYEQYYLPLCGSAAMLGAFGVRAWSRNMQTAAFRFPWIAAGLGAALLLGSLSIPIFIGQRFSPDTGADYTANGGQRKRGYADALKRVSSKPTLPWQTVGDYIRTHTTPDDRIYVWGWVPGIYVRAQRMAPVPKAFESDMHIHPPRFLARRITTLVNLMQANPPRFIVDSRKRHFPNDRPPLELWPHTAAQNNPYGTPLPNDPALVSQYDQLYMRLLGEQFDPRQQGYGHLPGLTTWLFLQPWTKAMPDEALRYEAMQPLRTFVMNNYRIVGHYGEHVLFERK